MWPAVNLTEVVAGTIKAEGTANAPATSSAPAFVGVPSIGVPSIGVPSIGDPAHRTDNLLVGALARDRLTPLDLAVAAERGESAYSPK